MRACILRSLMFNGGRLRLEGRATPSAQTLSVQSGKGCPAEDAAGEEWAPCCHQAGGRNPLDCELVGRIPALSGRWTSSLPPPAVLCVHELSGWNFFFLCHFLETATPPHLLCSNITRAISLSLAPCIVVQPHPQEPGKVVVSPVTLEATQRGHSRDASLTAVLGDSLALKWGGYI